jgi:acyl dehydratase
MSETKGLDKIKALVGQEVGLSDWFEVDQDRINKFAEATEDFQWIHVDKEMAAKGPFGTPIAHGYLTVSLLSHLSGCINIPYEGLNVQMAVNYGLNKVRLINPVTVNSKIRTRVVLQDVVEKGEGRILMTYAHTVEIEGQEKPACVAENLAMLFVQ